MLLVESTRTLAHALGEHQADLHLTLLSSSETVAALLFLWPRTMRLGGGVLIAILTVAAVAHALRGEFPGALLVYLAAVVFVTLQGRPPSP